MAACTQGAPARAGATAAGGALAGGSGFNACWLECGGWGAVVLRAPAGWFFLRPFKLAAACDCGQHMAGMRDVSGPHLCWLQGHCVGEGSACAADGDATSTRFHFLFIDAFLMDPSSKKPLCCAAAAVVQHTTAAGLHGQMFSIVTWSAGPGCYLASGCDAC